MDDHVLMSDELQGRLEMPEQKFHCLQANVMFYNDLLNKELEIQNCIIAGFSIEQLTKLMKLDLRIPLTTACIITKHYQEMGWAVGLYPVDDNFPFKNFQTSMQPNSMGITSIDNKTGICTLALDLKFD